MNNVFDIFTKKPADVDALLAEQEMLGPMINTAIALSEYPQLLKTAVIVYDAGMGNPAIAGQSGFDYRRTSDLLLEASRKLLHLERPNNDED